MKQTVFLAIPHHVFTSDLLRTKYIDYLLSKFKVVVFTPSIDSETAEKYKYPQSPDITYIKYPLEHLRFWSLFKFLRISLVNEFDYLASIKYWYRRPNYRDNWNRRILRFFGRPFSWLFTANFFSRLENILLPKSRKFEQLLQEYHPALVVTATPGFNPWEAPFIIWAKRHGIPTVAVNFTWDNLTMNAKHMRKTDYLIAWNNVMKKEAIDIHKYAADRIFVSGTPRFDPYFVPDKNEPTREEFLRSKGLRPEYPTLFHTTVTKAYPFQKKYIHDLINLRRTKQIPYVNLFIRTHPLDLYKNYEEFYKVPDLYIEKAGQEIDGNVEMNYQDLLNLKYSLKYTDLNINYASTITIEACVFDKPIINIGFIDRFALAYEFSHYKPIYDSGAVRLAKTDEDLPKLINAYLADPKLDSDRRDKIVKDYVGYTDGLSYKRSVDFLEKIIQ